MSAFVEGVIPCAFSMTDEDECFLFDFGVYFVRSDDGFESELRVWLFGPFFVMAEE